MRAVLWVLDWWRGGPERRLAAMFGREVVAAHGARLYGPVGQWTGRQQRHGAELADAIAVVLVSFARGRRPSWRRVAVYCVLSAVAGALGGGWALLAYVQRSVG